MMPKRRKIRRKKKRKSLRAKIPTEMAAIHLRTNEKILHLVLTGVVQIPRRKVVDGK